MKIAKINVQGKKFRTTKSLSSTCNCGSCNCNCGSGGCGAGLISLEIAKQLEMQLNKAINE